MELHSPRAFTLRNQRIVRKKRIKSQALHVQTMMNWKESAIRPAVSKFHSLSTRVKCNLTENESAPLNN